MKKIFGLICLVVMLGVVSVANAAPEFTVGYPMQCTDSSTDPTIAGTRWLTCAQVTAGSTALNPIYTTSVGASISLGAGVTDATTTRTVAATDSLEVTNTTTTAVNTTSMDGTLNSIFADTTAIITDTNQMVIDLAAIEVLLGTLDTDTATAIVAAWSTSSGVVDATTQRTVLATDSPSVTTAAPAYCRQQDQDSTTAADVLTAIASGTAKTENALMVAAALMLDNGATLDPALATASGGLQVGVESWPVAYDDGNAWVDTRKKAIKTLATPKQTSATDGGGTATTVIDSLEILGYPNCTFYVDNIDAGHDLTDADIQVSPDNSVWISLTWTACDSLGFGNACVYQLTNSSYRYARVQVTDDSANVVDIDAWVTCNVN
jgi:hypothetical protein